MIVWAFHGTESDAYDRAIVYSWAEGRWSSATLNTHWIVGSTLDGIDLDSLDAIYGDLDSIPISLDSVELQGGGRRLAAFANVGGSSNYQTFTGTPLEATFRTGESQPSPGQRVFVSEAYPLIEADSWDALISLYMRDNKGAVTTSNEVEVGWSGFAAVRGEGQKVAVQMRIPAGGEWGGAQGVQVRYKKAGYR